MGKNGTANFIAHAPLSQNRFAFQWVIRQSRVNLPIEIVEKTGDCPWFSVLVEFLRVCHHTRFDSQHVPAKTVALDELADNLPGFVSGHLLKLNPILSFLDFDGL